LTFALLLLLMKSSFYNRGLVSWKIGVSGGSLRVLVMVFAREMRMVKFLVLASCLE